MSNDLRVLVVMATAALTLSIAVLVCAGVLLWQFSAGSNQRYMLVPAPTSLGEAWLLDTKTGQVALCFSAGTKCYPFTGEQSATSTPQRTPISLEGIVDSPSPQSQ
jgi:hypothetical protein